MEDLYILVDDCIQNISSLFTFYPLLSLSQITKSNARFIFELTIHDHDNQPLFYSSHEQIKRFKNMHILTIGKYYSYPHLSELTHINDIRFYDNQLIDDLIHLTHLTSCRDGVLKKHNYFHTNFRKSLDFEYNYKKYNFNDIASFQHITYLNALKLNDCRDVNQLTIFTNLKSLRVNYLQNLSNISLLKSLNSLLIEDDNYPLNHDVVISH